jgi:AcrR family transcriptional regulator
MERMGAAALRAQRATVEQRFLDAAERLLVDIGYAGISTRRLAEEAGANHGLVHYYFGSMEELFIRVLERFTDRLIERQNALYASDIPYAEKWRRAMQYLDEDRPYQKIWFELQAMAWNRPRMRARIAPVLEQWKSAMRDAVRTAVDEYGLADGPLSADEWVTLISAFNEGIILERLSGVAEGHQEMLTAIQRWITARSNPGN